MKVLFIGTGVITYAHADGLKLIGSEPAACYDIFKPSAERFAKTYGCPALDDYKEYLDKEKIDYALLCTPPGVRLEYMEEIMSRGIPLYVEKPIATNMEDAIKMQEMAEKYNVPIMVNFVHCYRPAYEQMYKLVKDGVLGDPINVFSHRFGQGAGFRGRNMAASWRTNPKLVCGMTIESLSHDITMMTALCGNFKTVAANVQATVEALPTFDTNSAISMQIEKGGIATISASWSSDISFSMRGYVGTKGTAIVRGGGQFDLEDCIVKTDDMPYEQVTNYHDTYDNTLAQGMANAHKHFQDALTTGSEIRTPLESGIAALKVSLAALKSDKEKVVVTL